MIYLVRHGQSLSNISQRFSGITDVELSDLGKEQAKKAGLILNRYYIKNIFSSPLKRAHDTAKIIAGVIQHKNQIIIENSLMEINFGLFENLTWEEIYLKYENEAQNWLNQKLQYRFPQGESYFDIKKRIANFVDSIPEDSLVVTHYGVILATLLHLNIANDENIFEYTISNCDVVRLNKNKLEEIIKCII